MLTILASLQGVPHARLHLRRLVQSVIVMLTVALVAFALFRFVGDPIASMVGQETTLAERAELRGRFGAE
jgi:ABC-type dipeptide/oligopeptide/nickel transport system permease component